MLIECRIRRRNGSTSIMTRKDGAHITYRFLPHDAKGNVLKDPELVAQTPHTCEVEEVAHQRRFVMECAPSYAPHGDVARKLAEDRFGWTPDTGKAPEPARVAQGQPAVVEEIVGDDETPNNGDGSPYDTDDDTGAGEGVGAPPPPANTLPEWAKARWEEFAKKELGIGKPDDRNALEKYAKENFGVDLDKRRGHIVLIREIWNLHHQAQE